MLKENSKDTPRLCHEVLSGKRKLIVWGGNIAATLYEWQRQIKPLYMVDSQWTWWRKVNFYDLEIKSPIEIERLNPDKTLVINNYHYAASIIDKMDDFMERLGGYPIIEPLHLHEIARKSAAFSGKDLADRAMDEGFCQYVDDVLDEILTQPQDLMNRKKLPSQAKLEAFFGSYTREAYLHRTLKALRSCMLDAYKPEKKRVALVIGSLDYGGAERQICNLAVGLKRMGWEPTIYYLLQTSGGERYRNQLRENEVAFEYIGPQDMLTPDMNVGDLSALGKEAQRVLWYVDPNIGVYIINLYKKLIAHKPECLIGYLDATNIHAGFAGVLAGVPKIMLSGRSIAPTNFQHIYSQAIIDGFRNAYPYLLPLEGIQMVNNSSEGARSYAKWLGIAHRTVPVIPNCVSDDFLDEPSKLLVGLRKEQLCIRKDTPFVLGVFRMTKEKRAHDFVNIVAALHKKHPKLRAMICGNGPQRGEIEALIKKLKLQNVLHLGGLVEDVPLVMRCATFLLHTAEIEGSPNVILEAQASGLPIVCAENGGTKQFLAEEWKPYMHKPGQVKELTKAALKLLSDKAGSKKKAEAVRRRALRETTSVVLARNTLAAFKG